MKHFQHLDTEINKYSTHDQGTKDSPEEDFVLVYFTNLEIGKYENKYKEIIDTERLLDNIGGSKLPCLLMTEPLVDESGEDTSASYPNSAPNECFTGFDFVSFFIEDSQIEE